MDIFSTIQRNYSTMSLGGWTSSSNLISDDYIHLIIQLDAINGLTNEFMSDR